MLHSIRSYLASLSRHDWLFFIAFTAFIAAAHVVGIYFGWLSTDSADLFEFIK